MKKVFLLGLLTFFIGCDTIESKKNAVEDVKLGEEMANKFYNELIQNDTLKIVEYLDKTVPKEDFYNLINKNQSSYGKLSKHNINKIETSSLSKNGLKSTEYKIEAIVNYEKSNCLEYLLFTKDENGNIELNKYLVSESNQ